MNISVSKLFSGDFKSLIFELTRLILEHFVHRGTAGAHPFPAETRAPAGPGSRGHSPSLVKLGPRTPEKALSVVPHP